MAGLSGIGWDHHFVGSTHTCNSLYLAGQGQAWPGTVSGLPCYGRTNATIWALLD
jgi:hypothetical protein